MDPDAALQRIRSLRTHLLAELDSGAPDMGEVDQPVLDLLEYFHSLDFSLSIGGFLPSPWALARPAPLPTGTSAAAREGTPS